MEETSTISYYPLSIRVEDTKNQEDCEFLQTPELVGRSGMQSSVYSQLVLLLENTKGAAVGS